MTFSLPGVEKMWANSSIFGDVTDKFDKPNTER